MLRRTRRVFSGAFRADDHLGAARAQRHAQRLLAAAVVVALRRVEVVDAHVQRSRHHRFGRAVLQAPVVALAAAEPTADPRTGSSRSCRTYGIPRPPPYSKTGAVPVRVR
jgi:hypothetical protein